MKFSKSYRHDIKCEDIDYARIATCDFLSMQANSWQKNEIPTSVGQYTSSIRQSCHNSYITINTIDSTVISSIVLPLAFGLLGDFWQGELPKLT